MQTTYQSLLTACLLGGLAVLYLQRRRGSTRRAAIEIGEHKTRMLVADVDYAGKVVIGAIQRRFNVRVPRARVPEKRPRVGSAPRDDRSSENQPKRAEHGRERSLFAPFAAQVVIKEVHSREIRHSAAKALEDVVRALVAEARDVGAAQATVYERPGTRSPPVPAAGAAPAPGDGRTTLLRRVEDRWRKSSCDSNFDLRVVDFLPQAPPWRTAAPKVS